MKVWKVLHVECDNIFLGVAVVVAETENDVLRLITEETGVEADRQDLTITELDITKPEAHILWDGDY